jgi:hypothetical protein
LNVYYFIILQPLFLGMILSQSMVWASFLPTKKEGSGRIQTQIPKFGTGNFETLRGGKCFLAQIPNFRIWDLGRNFCAAVEVPLQR